MSRLPAWVQALKLMRDEDEELVYERGQCYVGLQRFAARTAFYLFRNMLVSGRDGHGNAMETYYINETGHARLEEALAERAREGEKGGAA